MNEEIRKPACAGWKLSPFQRSNATTARAAAILADVIGIGVIALGATIPGNLQIHQRLSIPTAQMPGLRRWIGSRAKVPKERSKTANKFRLSRNSAKASSRFRARGSDSCAIQSAILCRHRRTFLSRRKSFAVLLCATACGFTAKHAAAAAVLN